MVRMQPEEHLERIARARADYDRARSRLFRFIAEALAEHERLPRGTARRLGPSAIGRAAGFTREYIAKIRDGERG
jgi:hypothetical protein